MALPRKLKNLNLFGDGESYLGQVLSVKLPTLTRSMEDYRGGGMSGPVKIDNGQEALELESKFGGLMRSVLRQYGVTRHDGVQLRFAGAYQRDDTGETVAVEVVMRGRQKEIDTGEGKQGEDTESKISVVCTYFRLTMDGKELVEIDTINMIEKVNGVDRLEQHRRNIGL